MRPHVVAQLPSLPYQLVAHGDGYAALTQHGLVLLDRDVSIVETIGGEHSASRFLALADGRFVLFGDQLSFVYTGARERSFTRICDELFDAVHATPRGFIAVGRGRAWVDVGGERRWVDLAHSGTGSTAWGERVVVAGEHGLVVLDGSGDVVEHACEVTAAPIAVGASLVVPTEGGFDVLDAKLATVSEYESELSRGVAIGDRVLMFDERNLEAWNLATEEALTWDYPSDIDEPIVIGDKLVISSPEAKSVWIHDAATGDELARMKLAVRSAAPFGDGLALVINDSDEVVWWRPEGHEVLPHDRQPWRAFATHDGVIVAEYTQLLWWRTDIDGPEPAPITTTLPFDVPIVVDGGVVRVVGKGRAMLRTATASGAKGAIAPDAEWRAQVTRADAEQIVAMLIARTFDGPLPPLPDVPERAMYYAIAAAVASLPPAVAAAWHARAMFAPGTLDEQRVTYSDFGRERFFDELAQVLDVETRELIYGVKARKWPLVAPRAIADYEYLGAFTTDGKVIVSDVCYVTTKHTRPPLQLALHVEVKPGDWHAYARMGTDRAEDRFSELVAIHTDGFATPANEELAVLGVDAGQMGIYDHSAPEPRAHTEDGILGGLGVKTRSGFGDGFYPVYGGKRQGAIVKLRVDFLEEGTLDRTLPRAEARPYSAKTKFAVGDVLEHVKFGRGTVVHEADGKITVAFSDERRVLVHGKS